MSDIILTSQDGPSIILSSTPQVDFTLDGGLTGPTGPVDTAYTDVQIAALFHSANLTVTVGSGGDYASIDAAIKALSRLKSTYTSNGFAASINLLSGFTMSEQVFVRSLDLSWITITSVDAEVPVNTASITTELVDEDNIRPIIGGIDNAHLPIIDVLFAYPNQGDGYAASPMDGIAVVSDSKVLFKPGAGVKRPRNGLKVLYGSSAVCYMPGLTQGGGGSGAGTVTGVDFSYATDRALHVAYGSKANLARSQFHHADGDYAAYVIWGSHVDLYQSQLNDTANGNAITCRDSSYCNARETCVARSVRGYHALHNSRINARSKDDPGDPASIWVNDAAKDCTGYGALASHNSQIDASELDVSGSAIGVQAADNSSMDFNYGNADNCTSIGVSSQRGSTINANNSHAYTCGTGYLAASGSIINADTTHAENCTSDGYLADETSLIQARNSTADDCVRYGYYADRSSTINARGGSATACDIGFFAFEASNINAQSTSGSGAGTWGYSVDRGSTINAGSITGTTNQAVNQRTGKGLISDATLPVPSTWIVSSGVGTSVTGTTSETALATLTIPANSLGTKGMIRLTLNFSHTNNANVKTLRARLGGGSGTAFLSAAAASQIRTHVVVSIYNQNATNVQIGGSNAGNATGYGQSTSAQVTGAIDTTASQTIVISGELANTGDTIDLKTYLLEYHYQA